MKQIILADNLDVLHKLPDNFCRLIYIDSPFNSGKLQQRKRIKVKATDKEGDRIGFGGKQFITTEVSNSSIYNDRFDNFEAFLMPRIEATLHCLTTDGSLFVHLDDRESAYIRVAVDKLLGGRQFYAGQIVWSWDFGFRSKTKWSRKHNLINWWTLNPKSYVFNYDAMDRIPYMSGEGLVSKEKLARGKTPTSCWWNSIVGTNSKEKTGYPTQKPLGILNRIIKVHTNPGDVVLDFFAGSGSLGQAAENNGRGYVLIDSNPDATAIMTKRLPNAERIGF